MLQSYLLECIHGKIECSSWPGRKGALEVTGSGLWVTDFYRNTSKNGNPVILFDF
jgi:hypothetical protein